MFKRWHLTADDTEFPTRALQAAGFDQVECLKAIGARELLHKPRFALFCSRQCPGSLILQAHEWAARGPSDESVIVSGFHTPVEQECLRLFRRGNQPVIVCPARGLDRFRIPAAYRGPIQAGTLLLLSPFDGAVRRVTRAHAVQRNAWVAALADQIIVIHAATDGQTEQTCRAALAQGKACFTFDHPANAHLIANGAQPLQLRK